MSFIHVGDKILKLSNLEKIFYPQTRTTKREVLKYYRDIAAVILPHLKGRPLTLKRYPNGVREPYFYEKHCPSSRPAWFRTVEYNQIGFCTINDLASLLWVANLATIELHTQLCHEKKLEFADFIAFDLDPGPGCGLVECSEVALILKSTLDELELESYPKTSGSKGMQVYIPLNAKHSFDETKSFSHFIAREIEAKNRDLVVSRMSKSLRNHRVFIDWSQNDKNKTTVCAYSLRARERPMVSTPLNWREVERVVKKKNPSLIEFDYRQVLERISKMGDVFSKTLTAHQNLPAIQNKRAA